MAEQNVNLHDSVHVGDVVQNVNQTNECPACKTANVSVFSCKEVNCSERWCTYCGTGKPGTCVSCTAEHERRRIAEEQELERRRKIAAEEKRIADRANFHQRLFKAYADRRNDLTSDIERGEQERDALLANAKKIEVSWKQSLIHAGVWFLLFFIEVATSLNSGIHRGMYVGSRFLRIAWTWVIIIRAGHIIWKNWERKRLVIHMYNMYGRKITEIKHSLQLLDYMWFDNYDIESKELRGEKFQENEAMFLLDLLRGEDEYRPIFPINRYLTEAPHV